MLIAVSESPRWLPTDQIRPSTDRERADPASALACLPKASRSSGFVLSVSSWFPLLEAASALSDPFRLYFLWCEAQEKPPIPPYSLWDAIAKPLNLTHLSGFKCRIKTHLQYLT